MRTYMYLFLLVMTCCLTGCHSRKQNAQDHENGPVKVDTIEIQLSEHVEEPDSDDEYEDEGPVLPEIMPLPTRVPADIPAYFGQLEKKGLAAPITRDINEGEGEMVKKGLTELQRYATGKRKYYPVEEVNTTISLLSEYDHYASGHGGDESELNMVNNYRNHFIAIAAMLSPNMDFLRPIKDVNQTIGLMQFPDWSHSYPIQSYVLLPVGEKLSARSMNELNAVAATKIFRLGDEKGREYYLFSNDEDIHQFGQVLCMMDQGELKYVTRLTDLYAHIQQEGIIFFYPNKTLWHFCEDKDDRFQRIEGAPTIHLKLDGMNSKFYITISHRK